MERRWTNENALFASSTTANHEELLTALNNHRAEMKGAWDALDKDWKELNKRMVSLGIIKSKSLDNCMVHLNVGGSILNLRRVALESLHQKTLASMFDVEWDSRVPRDKEGMIFLDESPLIVKLLHNVRLMAAEEVRACGSTRNPHLVPADQLSYITDVSRFYGLQNSLVERHTTGVSAVLNDDEIGMLAGDMRISCPGHRQCLDLIYRASRDGFHYRAFRQCVTDEIHFTITLIEVGDNVIGGFSPVSWTLQKTDETGYRDAPDFLQEHTNARSPQAFIFLKESSIGKKGCCPLVTWSLPRDKNSQPSVRYKDIAPNFGNGGFYVSSAPPFKIFFGSAAPQMLKLLEGKTVSEIEAYHVCYVPEVPVYSPVSDVAEKPGHSHLFGDLIGSTLLEEKMAIHDAQAELALAKKKVEAAASALATVYGPDIASGKPDPVVELVVRGARMATLRSTLQVCPESALAARYDESKWPIDGKDFGVIDCRPSSFSKVLDVLRMKKREKWSHGALEEDVETKTSLVTITVEDRPSFEEFLDMYFPGCESFVTEVVEFEGSD